MFSITLIIIIITSLVSFTAFNNKKIEMDLLFWPAQIQRSNQYYRFLSHAFVHGDVFHLVFNMYSLYSLGQAVEQRSFVVIFGEQGKLFYLVLYVSAAIIAAIPDYYRHRNNSAYRAVGASGAVSAVIFACIILQPAIRLQILFIPVGIPGYIFGILFVAVSAYLDKKGSDNIAHGAHLSGAFYGLIFAIVTTRIFAGYDAVGIFLDAILNR